TPAGVRSIAVTVNGASLAAGAGSSLPTKFMAAVDTTKLIDGPVTISVTAVGNYANAGTSSITFKTDKTPPGQTVAQPADQFATNGNVQVSASAVDAGSGLASYVVTGLSGLLDTDTSVGGIAGSWSSASTAEGPIVATLKACDNVGNC